MSGMATPRYGQRWNNPCILNVLPIPEEQAFRWRSDLHWEQQRLGESNVVTRPRSRGHMMHAPQRNRQFSVQLNADDRQFNGNQALQQHSSEDQQCFPSNAVARNVRANRIHEKASRWRSDLQREQERMGLSNVAARPRRSGPMTHANQRNMPFSVQLNADNRQFNGNQALQQRFPHEQQCSTSSGVVDAIRVNRVQEQASRRQSDLQREQQRLVVPNVDAQPSRESPGHMTYAPQRDMEFSVHSNADNRQFYGNQQALQQSTPQGQQCFTSNAVPAESRGNRIHHRYCPFTGARLGVSVGEKKLPNPRVFKRTDFCKVPPSPNYIPPVPTAFRLSCAVHIALSVCSEIIRSHVNSLPSTLYHDVRQPQYTFEELQRILLKAQYTLPYTRPPLPPQTRYCQGETDWIVRCDGIEVAMKNFHIWDEFRDIQNEMIIAKNGRLMFPRPDYSIAGLNPNMLYSVYMDFAYVDENTWKYEQDKGRWKPNSPARFEDLSLHNTRVFHHPNSPALGKEWNSQGVKFDKLYMTNDQTHPTNKVYLKSMRACLPRLIIVEACPDKDNAVTGVWLFSMWRTMFITTTMYKNPDLAQLKTRLNPNAKSASSKELGETSVSVMTSDVGDTSSPTTSDDGIVSSNQKASASVEFNSPSCSSCNSASNAVVTSPHQFQFAGLGTDEPSSSSDNQRETNHHWKKPTTPYNKKRRQSEKSLDQRMNTIHHYPPKRARALRKSWTAKRSDGAVSNPGGDQLSNMDVCIPPNSLAPTNYNPSSVSKVTGHRELPASPGCYQTQNAEAQEGSRARSQHPATNLNAEQPDVSVISDDKILGTNLNTMKYRKIAPPALWRGDISSSQQNDVVDAANPLRMPPAQHRQNGDMISINMPSLSSSIQPNESNLDRTSLPVITMEHVQQSLGDEQYALLIDDRPELAFLETENVAFEAANRMLASSIQYSFTQV